MQVTDAMARAALVCWNEAVDQGELNSLHAMALAIAAALDVMPKASGGFIPGPSPRGDSILAKLSDGSCTFTLPKTPTQGPLPPGTTITFSPAGNIADIAEALAVLMGKGGLAATASVDESLLDTDGFEDLSSPASIAQSSIPVAEPRPLATEEQLHCHLHIAREAVAHMIAHREDYSPPFPQPVREVPGWQPLYDPVEVKAWYDGLPQAADG